MERPLALGSAPAKNLAESPVEADLADKLAEPAVAVRIPGVTRFAVEENPIRNCPRSDTDYSVVVSAVVASEIALVEQILAMDARSAASAETAFAATDASVAALAVAALAATDASVAGLAVAALAAIGEWAAAFAASASAVIGASAASAAAFAAPAFAATGASAASAAVLVDRID